MTLLQWVRRNRTHPALLIGATLFAGGLFKLSAFAREAFIAARFGLSTVTDTYFGLQQFPLTLATFMFGAFSLAFTPAYAEARRRSDSVSWLPGLTLYGCLLGALLTVLMLVSAPWLLRLFSSTPSAASWNTKAVSDVLLRSQLPALGGARIKEAPAGIRAMRLRMSLNSPGL